MSESSQLPPAKQNAVVNTNVDRGDLFRRLNEALTLNQYHLPEYVYRVDMIPLNYNDYPPEQKVNILNASALPITFSHGYPAIFESQPFWEQLPAESNDAFNAFMIYLELPEKSGHDNPVRMLPMIAELVSVPLEDIVAWSHMYYWHWRGRAYDLFLIACHRKQRELRLMSIEGKHFKMAEDFLERMNKVVIAKFDRIMDQDSADLDEIKLKDAIDSVQKLIQIQRISVGLAANGDQKIDVGPRHASAADVMQHVAKQSSDVSENHQRSAEMDKILSDPDSLMAVQDLITKMHQVSE